MKIPPIVYRGRDAIEALVPRNSAISAVVHVGAGVGLASGAALWGASFLPKPDPAHPEQTDRADFRSAVATTATLATLPLVLTAGMQLALPAERMISNGISPFYFIAAGAMFGAGFLVMPVNEAMKN